MGRLSLLTLAKEGDDKGQRQTGYHVISHEDGAHLYG